MGAEAKNYFTPAGYRRNERALTVESSSGVAYWTPERIHHASEYQFGVYAYAADLIRERGIGSVVDVGCGVAPKLAYLNRHCPGVRITGIDQPSAIEYCRRAHGFGTWLVDDFEHPRAELDAVRGELVITSDVIEHLDDPDNLLAYLRGRVAPGGRILLSTPDRDALHGPGQLSCPNPSHVREWSFGEFRAYLEDRGFVVLEHFHDFAVRVAPTRLFLGHALHQFRPWSGRRLRFNQVCLLALE